MRKQKHIAIIGGGYTGLTAAYELLKKGYNVSIFEYAKELGGLAAGFTIEGMPIERAYHHLFHTDTDIISLVNELGLQDELEWFDSSIALCYDNKIYPFMTPGDLLSFKPLSFFNRLRAGIIVFFLQKMPFWRMLIKSPAYTWMKVFSGNAVTKVIWEPLLRGKFHEFYDSVSMAWLWARLYTRANSRRFGETKEKLGYFKNGFQVITKALENKIVELGGQINLGAQIEYIDERADENVAIKVNGTVQMFDAAIATVPSYIFAHLVQHSSQVTPDYITKLTSIKYLGASLLIFSSEQSLSKYYWHNINDMSSPFLVFIQHTNLVGSEQYNNQHVYYIGTYVPHDHRYMTMTKEQLEDEWFAYLRKIFPEFDRNKVRETYKFAFKNAQHIVTTDYEQLIPAYQTPLKNVFLANFSQIFPFDRGTNYAVREGRKIATLLSKSVR
jgi:protoporphyrinogen oxidase